MKKISIRDLDLQGKLVLVRVDFNVPFKKDKDLGEITISDDTRIVSALPTIKYLIDKKAKVVLCSHAGRPNGKADLAYSLKPVSLRLKKLLDNEVYFVDDCIGEETQKAKSALANGEVALLENLRFHKEETANDKNFAKELSQGIDYFVNDAFGTAHRAHASTVGVTKFVSVSAMGFLLENELKYLIDELENPKKPFVAILGGAKVSDKIGVIETLIKKSDAIIIGGAMAYTFAKAIGEPVGKSLVEEDKLDLALKILQVAKENNTKLLLPVDSVAASEFSENAEVCMTKEFDKNSGVGGVPEGFMGLDIGTKTIEIFRKEILQAKTIVWNGPMGVFEMQKFADGTKQIALAVAEATSKNNATTIVGGGDSVTAIKKFKLGNNITFISTGGGASLQLLEGKCLPAVEALSV